MHSGIRLYNAYYFLFLSSIYRDNSIKITHHLIFIIEFSSSVFSSISVICSTSCPLYFVSYFPFFSMSFIFRDNSIKISHYLIYIIESSSSVFSFFFYYISNSFNISVVFCIVYGYCTLFLTTNVEIPYCCLTIFCYKKETLQ